MGILTAAIPLIMKTLWLSAHWARLARKHALRRIARHQDPQAEIIFVRDRVAELETALTMTRLHGRKPGIKPCYTAKERLLVIWYVEHFQAHDDRSTSTSAWPDPASTAGCGPSTGQRNRAANPPTRHLVRPRLWFWKWPRPIPTGGGSASPCRSPC